jgi:hypothetical protein
MLLLYLLQAIVWIVKITYVTIVLALFTSILPTPSSPTSYFEDPSSCSHPIYLLPSTFYLLPSTFYLLPSTFYLLPSTFYLLPSTFYLLPSPFSLLPSPFSPSFTGTKSTRDTARWMFSNTNKSLLI